MRNYKFSVVIATFNRPELCAAAVASVLLAAADKHCVQVVVVDDASDVALPHFDNSHVNVFRQEKNAGPGPARMRGIREGAGQFVIILDDDDELRIDAFDTLSMRLAELPDQHWLVLQFATSNASSTRGFDRLTFDHYMAGRVRGDYTPVFHRERFLASGFVYPETRLGGEHLLWWALSSKVTIPTWQDVLVNVGEGAAERLTDTDSQIRRAHEHLSLADATWDNFGTELREHYPHQANRVLMGGVTYAVLAEHRLRAFRFFVNLRSPKQILMAMAILILPRRVAEVLFRRFRARQLNSAT